MILRVWLRTVNFKKVSYLFNAHSGTKASATADPIRFANLVSNVSKHHLFTPTCLEQALVLYGYLRDRGIDAQMQIGTSLHQGQFRAHAWVELSGKVILGTTTFPFTSIRTYNTLDPKRFL